MRYILFVLVLLSVSACSIAVGELPPERLAIYEKNKPDCSKNPEKCVHGYPW